MHGIHVRPIGLLTVWKKADILLISDSAFKIQLKAMLIDQSLNSVATVLANLHQSFVEAAVRCLEYARALSKARTTCSNLLISTSKVSRFVASTSKSRKRGLRG
jgi:hypothetical protein